MFFSVIKRNITFSKFREQRFETEKVQTNFPSEKIDSLYQLFDAVTLEETSRPYKESPLLFSMKKFISPTDKRTESISRGELNLKSN